MKVVLDSNIIVADWHLGSPSFRILLEGSRQGKLDVYVPNYHTYRQLLYQTIKRAISLNYKMIDFGMTAEFEKRKLGATIEPKVAYVQTSDNYSLELMGLIEGN